MVQAPGLIICLGYILGLLLSANPWGGVFILFLSVVIAVVFQRQRIVSKKLGFQKTNPKATKKAAHNLRTIPHPRILLVAGLIGLLATFYFQLRVPQPEDNDISRSVPLGNSKNQEQLVIVRGEVVSTPRLTRSGKGQFWLNATQISDVTSKKGEEGANKGVTGKL